MKNFLKASIVVGVLLGIQPANALPIESNFRQNEVSSTSEKSLGSLQARNNQDYVNPISETQDPRIEQIVFDFDNSYDYGTCLDAILLAYENRVSELQKAAKNDCTEQVFSIFDQDLSKDTTLKLIELANYYATNELDIKLYPAWGLRRRVAINFGYIYDIDRNNNDVSKYLSSNK